MLNIFSKNVTADEKTIEIITRLVCVSLFVTYLVIHHGFGFTSSELSLAPAFDGMVLIPESVTYIAYNISLLSILCLFIKPDSKIAALTIFLTLVYFVCRELTFLQPYLYMYITTIIICVFFDKSPHLALNALRIMVGGVYFWAGYHKINLSFYAEVFPWFIEPFYKIPEKPPFSFMDQIVVLIMLAVPLFEALIGVFLVFCVEMRKIATLMSFIMLVVVLACLGPLGHNYGNSVWPWNVYLFGMEYILFFNFKEKISFAVQRHNLLSIATAVMFWLAPVFAMVNPWMQLLGFKLYAGNTYSGEVVFTNEEDFKNLPPALSSKVKHAKNHDDKEEYTLDWTQVGGYYKKMFTPYPYVMQRTSQGLCKYLGEDSNVRMRIIKPNSFYSLEREFEESPLCKTAK